MKRLGVVSTTGLFLLLGFTVPAGAQQQEEKQQEKQPEKQEKPAQAKPPKQEQEQERQAQPEKRPEPAKQQESKPQQPEKSARQEPAPAKNQQQVKKGQEQPEKAQQPSNSAKHEQTQQAKGNQAQNQHQQQGASAQRPQHTPQEEARQRAQPALRLSARGSGRISDARFHSNFGRGHEFHVGTPTLVGGYSRFHYGGYWFGFVEPWPVGWYYTDDVYIDYVDGGYYMYNPYYPDTRFALTVVI
jgi:hypothetical protein